MLVESKDSSEALCSQLLLLPGREYIPNFSHRLKEMRRALQELMSTFRATY